MRYIIGSGWILCASALSACTLGPDYQSPEFPFAKEWFAMSEPIAGVQTQADEEKLARWWLQFHDPLLNQLIEQALNENKNIQEALANIDKARALRRGAASAFYPSVSASTSGERRGNSRLNRSGGFSAGERERDSYNAMLDVNWELDLFGRTRRAVEAADASIEASQALMHGVRLSVLAETASTYFQVRGLQKRIDITQRNIELFKEVESLAQARFESGATTEFDLARARGERQAVEAIVPNLQAQLMDGMYRLSVLTGQQPEYHVARLQQATALPAPADMVPVGMRSTLLKRRPDIWQAERELASSTALIGVAEAGLFPDISLSGAIGTSAQTFGNLFMADGFTYLVGSVLSLPLFEGGALRADIAAANAEAKAALARYEQTLLNALRDVESSLVNYGKEWQTLERLRAVQDSREEAFRIARMRYEAGEEDFLVILDAERALVTARNDIIASETRILVSLTQLYKALGGGWQQTTDVTNE